MKKKIDLASAQSGLGHIRFANHWVGTHQTLIGGRK